MIKLMEYKEFKQRFNLSLNYQQEAAVQKAHGPVLLLAVPGSGKTTVLVSRLGYLIYCCGVKPEEILVTTYTVAATKDMRRRFSDIFGDTYAGRLEFRTINGISSRIIKHYEREYGRNAFDLVTDEASLSQLAGEAYRKAASEFADESDIKDARTQITYIKNMRLRDEEIDQLKIGSTCAGPIYREYCRMMRDGRLMDYDDQMIYAYNILQKYPDILDCFQERYHYFCVDEAQDTSKIQHMIIRLLADKSRNLFMVGDEDQSIYGFRAAYPEALIDFNRIYPEATCLLMTQNYRSTKQIVAAADRFIQKNSDRHPKHMTTDNAEGISIGQIWVFDRKAQYDYLAGIAGDCVTETAVLFRDNDSALPIIDLLERRGIKYRCRQLESTFFSHKIIRDISDIIGLAYDPADSERFIHIYYKLNAGISKVQAVAAAESARVSNEPVLEHLLSLSSLSSWTIKQVKALQTHLTNMKNETAERALYRIVKFMGYGDYLAEKNMDTGKIDILSSLASRVERPDALIARLDNLREIVKTGGTGTDCPFILSTIHSSKGLEYNRVILVDVIDGILPKMQLDEASKPSEIPEEERRLFYVAMTRAKQDLTLIRFRKDKLASAFATELFPPKPVKLEPPKTQASVSSTAGRGMKSELINKQQQESILAAKDFVPEARVVHKNFGAGVITERDDATVSICFDNGTQKRFGLIASLNLGVLHTE